MRRILSGEFVLMMQRENDKKYIDIGLNLFSEQFRGHETDIVENAHAKGVSFIITGSSLKNSRLAAEFCEKYPDKNLSFTAGIHPHDAKNCEKDTLNKIRSILRDHRKFAAAVGECGLDYDRMFSPADVQRWVFEEHIVLAEELGLPLFLHERSAAEDFAKILSVHPEAAKRAVVHCFTGNRATVEKYLDMGCMIGITGWVCDNRRNVELLDALEVIPADRLMAETDGPYLLPRGIKGLKNPNVPENIVYVVRKIAEVKGIDEEKLRIQILENTVCFFRLFEN